MTRFAAPLIPALLTLALIFPACSGDGASSSVQETPEAALNDNGTSQRPPSPSAVLTVSGPAIPELTDQDKERIREIALGDSRLREVLIGREYEVGEPFIWHSFGLEKLGGGMIITFDAPFTLERDWLQLNYDETEIFSPPFQSVVVHFRAEEIAKLYLRVDLQRQELVEISPDAARISNYVPPSDFTAFPTLATPYD